MSNRRTRKRRAYRNGVPSIPDLTAQGYEVYISHERTPVYENNSPTSGKYLGQRVTTSVALRSPDGVGAHATATCHPNDNWDRKKGIAIAHGRAWKNLQLKIETALAFTRLPAVPPVSGESPASTLQPPSPGGGTGVFLGNE